MGSHPALSLQAPASNWRSGLEVAGRVIVQGVVAVVKAAPRYGAGLGWPGCRQLRRVEAEGQGGHLRDQWLRRGFPMRQMEAG